MTRGKVGMVELVVQRTGRIKATFTRPRTGKWGFGFRVHRDITPESAGRLTRAVARLAETGSVTVMPLCRCDSSEVGWYMSRRGKS